MHESRTIPTGRGKAKIKSWINVVLHRRGVCDTWQNGSLLNPHFRYVSGWRKSLNLKLTGSFSNVTFFCSPLCLSGPLCICGSLSSVCSVLWSHLPVPLLWSLPYPPILSAHLCIFLKSPLFEPLSSWLTFLEYM